VNIQAYGLTILKNGIEGLQNVSHNISNINTPDAKTLETHHIERVAQGVQPRTFTVDKNPNLVDNMPKLLLYQRTTQLGIKLIKTYSELSSYILDIKK